MPTLKTGRVPPSMSTSAVALPSTKISGRTRDRHRHRHHHQHRRSDNGATLYAGTGRGSPPPSLNSGMDSGEERNGGRSRSEHPGSSSTGLDDSLKPQPATDAAVPSRGAAKAMASPTAESAASEMSRRKQRNPKPVFAAAEEDEEVNAHSEEEDRQDGDRPDREVEDGAAHEAGGDPRRVRPGGRGRVEGSPSPMSGRDMSRGSLSSVPSDDDENEDDDVGDGDDLSSMVKVEVHEDSEDTGASAPHEATKDSELSAGDGQPPPSTTPRPPYPAAASSMRPMAGIFVPNEELLLASKQANMFHFGDVVMSDNHPDAPPVPMMLPMAYLFPIPPGEHFFLT